MTTFKFKRTTLTAVFQAMLIDTLAKSNDHMQLLTRPHDRQSRPSCLHDVATIGGFVCTVDLGLAAPHVIEKVPASW